MLPGMRLHVPQSLAGGMGLRSHLCSMVSPVFLPGTSQYPAVSQGSGEGGQLSSPEATLPPPHSMESLQHTQTQRICDSCRQYKELAGSQVYLQGVTPAWGFADQMEGSMQLLCGPKSEPLRSFSCFSEVTYTRLFLPQSGFSTSPATAHQPHGLPLAGLCLHQ